MKIYTEINLIENTEPKTNMYIICSNSNMLFHEFMKQPTEN